MNKMKFCDFAEINPPVKLTKGTEYPCVMMDEITPGRRYVLGENKKPFNGGSRFQKGDVLFARITPCLENGKIAQYMGDGSGFGSTEYFIFRQREGVSNPSYIFYLAISDIVRKPAEKSMFGASGRQRADLNAVMNIEVPAPSLPIQQRIADILSVYDNLIENNARRIRIVEQMAQAIYQEWFRRVEKIKGWELKSFSELVDIDPAAPVDKQIEKPFVGMNSISESSMIINLDLVEMRTGSSGAKFQNRDVLFPRITPSVENGKGAFVQSLKDGQVAIGSTEIIVFREKEINAEYIYFLSREREFRGNAINSMIGASGRQRVQQKCFDSFMVAKPPKILLEKFADIVSPMFKITHALALKNANLRQTRDLLLPRLVSGEIEVTA
jgi:type I restriction enzyme S subunit